MISLTGQSQVTILGYQSDPMPSSHCCDQCLDWPGRQAFSSREARFLLAMTKIKFRTEGNIYTYFFPLSILRIETPLLHPHIDLHTVVGQRPFCEFLVCGAPAE